MNGYICFYKSKKIEVMADSSYEAQQKAAKQLKVKKAYEITVCLAEKNGEQITHSTSEIQIKEKTMPKSYEKLIGKIIDWSSPNWKDNKVFKVVVANIDPDLGISLVNPDDPKDTFTCLHGPSSPLHHEMRDTMRSPLPWEERFKLAIEMISSGHWETEKYAELIKISGTGSNCSNPTCVFTM